MNIGLLWHSFSSGNLGVGALSLANLELIDSVVKARGLKAHYIVIGSSGPCDYSPRNDKYSYEFVEFSEKTLLKRPQAILGSIRKCDVVFDIGEGDSFADIYGYKRIAKLLLSKALVVLSKKTLVLSPQTIGPFHRASSIFFAKKILRRCKETIARDQQSFAVLKDMGVENIAETIDVAFSLPYQKMKVKTVADKIAVGINISALLHAGGYNGGNQFSLKTDYVELTKRLIEHLLARPEFEIHLVPHVIPTEFSSEDDYAVSEVYAKKYDRIILAPRFKGPEEAKSYISGLDYFTGARMHATIGAFSSSVPVTPLAYSRKFAGLFNSINYTRVLDLREQTTEDVLTKILSDIDERAKLKNEIHNAKASIDSRLEKYKSIINRVIGDVTC